MDASDGGMTAYAALLARHAQERGVDYLGWRQERALFAGVLDAIAAARPDHLSTPREPLAFWLNAYNAICVLGVLDRLPLPSVNTVPGFFSRTRYRVAGANRTIDEVERQARACGDYRAHFALTCASRGAPPLRNEPYAAERLEAQIEDQGRRWLADPRHGCRLDPAARVVWVSRIFHWSSPDLIRSRLPNTLVAPWLSRRILATIQPYLAEGDRFQLANGRWRLRYLPYDWALNR